MSDDSIFPDYMERICLSEPGKTSNFFPKYGPIGGLTKRELFAALIFAVSSQDWMNAVANNFEGKTFGDLNEYCAKVAVMRADALLAELNNPPCTGRNPSDSEHGGRR